MSSKFERLVVPTIGAETPGLERIQAIATCAMLMPFFFAISSTLMIWQSQASVSRELYSYEGA